MLVKQFREFTLASGVVFKGLSTKREPLTGDGQLIYPDGSIYVGQIRKGLPHGHGEKIWSDVTDPHSLSAQSSKNNIAQNDALSERDFQKTYKGNWLHGKMEGFGELTMQEGEVYIGNFKNGYPNGQGIRKWPNGDFYEGQYANGYQTGVGLFLSQDQGWKYEGEWQAGKMDGEGTCQWRDGTSYTGTWKNCLKEGQGVLTYGDGSKVEDSFAGDYPDGRGTKTFPDGSVYRGGLTQGLFHGHGKYKQPVDGSEYTGNWVKNEMKGEGVKKLKWGKVEIGGNFNNG